ncbi:MAG: hypothetical protein IKL37_01420, partial [Alphaproteobacteria bacterium]|nr:hypothetical protein [Alphaproteobacteria bacterium]
MLRLYRGEFVQNCRGNFLFQALLALGLVFAFMPFMARKITEQNADARMHAATHQIDVAQTAARIFIQENAKNIPFDTTVITGNDFADTLEPYGLPLGFVPKTALGQDIALVIHKTPVAVSAYLELTDDKLSELTRAELARRIGFYAMHADKKIQVGIELAETYSDVVRRNEKNLDNAGFLADLKMGNFSINNAGDLFAVRGQFDSVAANTINVIGTEAGRKIRSNIENMTAGRTIFQSQSGESALTLTRGELNTNSVYAKTLSKFGGAGNINAENAAAYDMSMVAGHTAFTGPGDWNVGGALISDRINFDVERLDVSSFINAARGQDVYIDNETLEYSAKSGIEVGTLYTSNVTLRDQTSVGLDNGKSGATIIDIRPAGTSLLPDALVADINNDEIKIIDAPAADDDKTIDCKAIIEKFSGAYNKQSLSQYLICQYVFWQRLEKRINIKQCLMA